MSATTQVAVRPSIDEIKEESVREITCRVLSILNFSVPQNPPAFTAHIDGDNAHRCIRIESAKNPSIQLQLFCRDAERMETLRRMLELMGKGTNANFSATFDGLKL